MNLQPGPDSAAAWVESPLQLLNAVEYAHQAPRSQPLTVLWRQRVRQLNTTAAWIADRAAGIVTVRPAQHAWHRQFLAARTRIVGDAFSGQYRLAISALGTRREVLLDDGSAALHLAASLSATGQFERLGQHESWPMRALGEITARRLRRAATRGRLTWFTAYATDPLLATVPHARIVPNEYTWLRAQHAPSPDGLGTTIILGSALAIDGYLDPMAYEEWVRSLGPEATYLPHRRESAAFLARLAGAGLRVHQPALPAEITVGLADRVNSVHSLPSSTSATLRWILGSTRLTVHPVPDAWWTAAASPALRSTLAHISSTSAPPGEKEN
ncbi:MAG: hypothetical protein ACK5LN_06360 [Propioniciclava sp.]